MKKAQGKWNGWKCYYIFGNAFTTIQIINPHVYYIRIKQNLSLLIRGHI